MVHPDSSAFRKILTAWYLDNKRDLPWRHTKDPYKIWLSEIILQQTRVAQGLPYYLKFVKEYPRVQELAAAPEEEVLKLWQGLGYYSRARNLLSAARTINQDKMGVFPDNYHELLKLKGVGEYTAAAIASFCFGEQVPVVDGNVFRVLSRIFGIDTPINTTAGKKEFKTLAAELIDPENPGTFNQAIMEFGALHCVPQSPDCARCVFRNHCVAFATGTVKELPVKLKKGPVKKRYFNYVMVRDGNGKYLMRKRKGNGIWKNLYEPFLVEVPEPASDLAEQQDFLNFAERYEVKCLSLRKEEPIIHKLSHQHIFTHFWEAETRVKIKGALDEKEVLELPVPALIARFLENYFKNVPD